MMLPWGTTAYVGTDPDGNRWFITPDNDDWLRMFSKLDAAHPMPVQQGPDNTPPQPMAIVNMVDVSNVTHNTYTTF